MDLTVIVTCKGRIFNLGYCIASIATAISTPKVIIVDFGNKKDMKYFERIYPWIRVIKATNNTNMFHKARALNIGIRAADTKFICLTDVDQIFQPNFFDVVIQTLRNDDNTIVRCKTYFLRVLPQTIKSKHINHNTYFRLLRLARKNQLKKPHGEGCCHALKKDILTQINGYDENYIGWGFEDKDLTSRVGLLGIKSTWVTKKTSMIHLPHARDKIYFSPNVRRKNENLYRRKMNDPAIVANQNKEWGKL